MRIRVIADNLPYLFILKKYIRIYKLLRMSMDGRGRVYANIFVERLKLLVKKEEVYLHDYPWVPMARSYPSDYFESY